VDEALNAGFEFHERAVIGNADNAAHNLTADLIALGGAIPGVRHELLHAQRDALLGGVVLQNLNGDLETGLQNLRGVGYSAVGDVCDVE
jgi:hypothetical protein